MFTTVKTNRSSLFVHRWIFSFILGVTTFGIAATSPAAFKAELQGLSAGGTNWISQNLMGWKELDFIPCRVYMTGGPANNKTISIASQRMILSFQEILPLHYSPAGPSSSTRG